MQAQRNGTLEPGSTESAIRQWQMSSFEVEQVLLSHTAVANAAAVPVRSSLAEDEVMAAVILHPGRQLAEADLIAFCEPRLPYFAVPRYLEFMDELPTTENGKVQKYKLRERGVTERTWDREASGDRHTRHTDATKRLPP